MNDFRLTSLIGHSGCKVILYESYDSDLVFVRKVSSSKSYNQRLSLQAKKQKDFNNKTIKAPAVFNTGFTDEGLFFFDMEYIQGITLAEYMKTVEIGRIHSIVENIVRNIVPTGKIAKKSNENVFVKKISSLGKTLFSLKDEAINQGLEILKNHSWNNFYESPCHGDLTLENIIIQDNQLYFIDFLDSFHDSWILDVGALLQDVQALWSYRELTEININTILRLMVFRDVLIDEIKARIGDGWLEIYYALLLKLVRIYPYSKDCHTKDFLKEKIKSVVAIIKENKR